MSFVARTWSKDVRPFSRLTLSIAFAFPFAFSFARRMDSPIVLRSSLAFLARSRVFCRRSSSSEWSDSSSSTGGTVSDWFLKSEERGWTGWGWGSSLDDMAARRTTVCTASVVF